MAWQSPKTSSSVLHVQRTQSPPAAQRRLDLGPESSVVDSVFGGDRRSPADGPRWPPAERRVGTSPRRDGGLRVDSSTRITTARGAGTTSPFGGASPIPHQATSTGGQMLSEVRAADGHLEAPRLVEPPPADADVFHFETVEPQEGQLMAMVRAAMEGANLNASVVNTVNKLVVAARQQHADSVALAQQQQRDVGRLEAAWNVAAATRESLARTDETLDRHMRTTEEINGYLQMEVRRQRESINTLLARTRRNERLLRARATEDLARANTQKHLRSVFTKWRQRGAMHRAAHSLLRGSTLNTRREVWAAWGAFIARRRRLRIWFRHLDYLEDKNNRVLARRYIGKFSAFVARKRALKHAATRLLRGTVLFRAQSAFTRWRQAIAQRCSIRERLAVQMKGCGALAQAASARTRRVVFNGWALWRAKRQDYRRRLRHASHLAVQIHATHCRSAFWRWLRVARTRRAKRERFVDMKRSNALLLARKYYGRWERWRWQRWIHAQIAQQVQPVERKVDIGLRTTSNTNETIQKLIENFQYLESKLQELRVSSRSGILGMREGSADRRGGAGYSGFDAALPGERSSSTPLPGAPMPPSARPRHPIDPTSQAGIDPDRVRFVAGALNDTRTSTVPNPYLPTSGTRHPSVPSPAAAAAVAAASAPTTPGRTRTFRPTVAGHDGESAIARH